MPRMRRVAPIILLILVVVAGLWATRPPDRIRSDFGPWKDVAAIVNAKVITLDASGRMAQAVAIRDGRFAAVGSNTEVRRLIESWGRMDGKRIIDARGHIVIPGLIDSHVHALMVAAAEAKQPFAGLSSIAEIQDWIRKRGRTSARRYVDLEPAHLPDARREHRFPTRAELDAAAPFIRWRSMAPTRGW